MALFLRQTEDRSKLQERLAAEMQARTQRKQLGEQDKLENQSYLKNTRTTSSSAVLWLFLIIAVIVAGVLFMLMKPA